MCEVIRLSNGTNISNLYDFVVYFRPEYSLFSELSFYQFSDCLCTLDLHEFFKINSEHKFAYHAGDWWQVDTIRETIKSCRECLYADKETNSCKCPNINPDDPDDCISLNMESGLPDNCPMDTTEVVLRWK